MACVGCQERREAIKAMAEKVGAIVFGGRKRKLADFAKDDGKKDDQAGLDSAAADPGVGSDRARRRASSSADDGAIGAVSAAAAASDGGSSGGGDC